MVPFEPIRDRALTDRRESYVTDFGYHIGGYRMFNRRSCCVLVLSALASTASVTASAGGYEVGENGPRAMGRAGAYVAHVDEAGALYYNPAGLSRTEGFNFNMNANLAAYFGSFDRDTYIFPDESGYAIRYEKVLNEHRFLPNPMLFVSHDFGLENVSFGAGIYAPAAVPRKSFPRMDENAINPTGAQPVVSRPESNAYQLLEQNLFALYPSIGFGAEIPEINFRLGLTFQLVYVQTNVTVAVDGAGFTDGQATLFGESQPNGYFSEELSSLYTPSTVTTSGISGTGILGLGYDPIPQLSFGFTYRPQHKVITEGDVRLDLSQQLIDNGVQLDGTETRLPVNFPHVLRFGVDYRHLDDTGFELFDIELNVVHERWSVVDNFDVDVDARVSDDLGFLQQFQLPVIRVPFHFNNTTSFRLGSDINVLRDRETGDGVALRAGVFYETAATPEAYTNLLFTSFNRIGVSAGTSIEINNWAFDLAAMFVHSPERTVNNGKFRSLTPLWICNDVPEGKPGVQASCEANPPGAEPGAIVNNGTYRANYLIFSAGITYGW